ncbi:MAG: hypothetical protein L6Q83_04245 [Gammaproteobacteria bacterium]|nr:hypothetical protein [Gammaproteobacteria bacterium]
MAKAPKSEADKYKSLSGFEGHEEALGRSMSVLLKMLNNHAGYSHEMNDPLVKAHLLAIQYAKNHGGIAQYVEHDIATMMPINLRMKQIIEKTGHKEIALVALFDRTACHYALALTSTGDGRTRRWKEPFGYVLQQCRKIGQFDLTVEEIHEQWTRPRLLGYAKSMGVDIRVSDIGPDGMITVELVD